MIDYLKIRSRIELVGKHSLKYHSEDVAPYLYSLLATDKAKLETLLSEYETIYAEGANSIASVIAGGNGSSSYAIAEKLSF